MSAYGLDGSLLNVLQHTLDLDLNPCFVEVQTDRKMRSSFCNAIESYIPRWLRFTGTFLRIKKFLIILHLLMRRILKILLKSLIVITSSFA